MTTLSSLLIARKAATIAEMDEALERQVMQGGDLATSLLELGAVSEGTLLPLLSEALGIAPAQAGPLPQASRDVLRLVPRAVALRYGLFPVEERDGELSVVVSEPLPRAVEDDLAFALGERLRQRVAPLVRIHEAIARDYGGSLEPRYARLISKLGRDASSAFVVPSRSASVAPRPPSLSPSGGPLLSPSGALPAGPSKSRAGDSARPPASSRFVEQQASFAFPERSHTWPGVPAPAELRTGSAAGSRMGGIHSVSTPGLPTAPVRPASIASAPAVVPDEAPVPRGGAAAPSSGVVQSAPPIAEAAQSSDAATSAEAPEGADSPADGKEMASAEESAPLAEESAPLAPDETGPRPIRSPPPQFVMEATMATAANVEKKRNRRAARPSGHALVGWARRAAGDPIAPDRPASRRRGPLTPADAERDLDVAPTGDQALTVFFDFSRQYFEYSALFVVHGDLAAGHNAWGPGASRDKVRAIGVALDLPSSLSRARTQGSPLVTLLSAEGLDDELREDLQRPRPSQVLLLPVLVFGRCVALLYGDDGEQPVKLGEIGEVLAMTSLAERALERILMRKKRGGGPGLRPGPSPSDVPTSESPSPSPTAAPAAGTKPADPNASPSDSVTVPDRPAIAPSALAQPVAVPPESEPVAPQSETVAAPPVPERAVPEPLVMPLIRPRKVAKSSTAQQPATPAGAAATAGVQPAAQSAGVQPAAQSVAATGESAEDSAAMAMDGELSAMDIVIDRQDFDDAGDDAPEITVRESSDDDLLRAVLDSLEDRDESAALAVAARSNRPASIDPGAASASIAVEPHQLPISRAHHPALPSVLIRPELVDQVVAGGDEGDRALGEILSLGEAAIPSVFSRFPGPLVVDRTQSRGDLPRPADCGPVLRIVAAMRRLALPFLAVRSADADPEVRFWATYLLGELHYPDAAAALLPRLFDENAAVRRIAIRSGRALVAGDDDAALPLRRSLERMVAYPDEPESRRLVAIGVVGELRVYRCIPALIAALSDASRLIVETSAHTLSTLTRQEYGTDARKWGEWWETKGRKRLP